MSLKHLYSFVFAKGGQKIPAFMEQEEEQHCNKQPELVVQFDLDELFFERSGTRTTSGCNLCAMIYTPKNVVRMFYIYITFFLFHIDFEIKKI